MVPRLRDRSPSSHPPSVSPQPKASLRSLTSSFEADDEGSPSSSLVISRFEMLTYGREPEYPGEDTRPTSKKELYGWYSYGWAAEVFAICGLGSFIPITLEGLARSRGVLLKDRQTPCDEQKSIATPPAQQLLSLFTRSEEAVNEHGGQCIFSTLGVEMNTASFAMYTFSLSVLFQALVIISMSGAADHGRYRKKFMILFALGGAVATMLFLGIVPSVILLGSMLAIVSNTCFGASFVLLNSFLPVIVRYHPIVQKAHEDDHLPGDRGEPSELDGAPLASSTTALLPTSESPDSNLSPPPRSSPELQLSTQVSSYGIGIGYLAGVLVQLLAIFFLLITDYKISRNFALRCILFFVGLWWLFFTLPAAIFLRPRPGPPLPSTQSRSCAAYVSYAWRSLGKTILRARHLRDVVIFLLAWFCLSDALATVSSTAILFAKTEIGMKEAQLAFINVIATLFGVLGAFTWATVSRFLGLPPVRTIMVCIALFELIPLYGLLPYVPFIAELGVFGLQQEWELYLLGAVYGLVLGGVGGYCRAVFSEIIPKGSESAFFALYAITDKGSSIFGPLIVGAITDKFGSIRPAFIFLAVLIGLPLPLMALVDVDRGKREAARMARILEVKRSGSPEGTGQRDGEEASLLIEEEGNRDR